MLSRFKAQPHIYPTIDISYSASEPLATPVILNLPTNGFRLRFDGPDQRLRLIEVLDFSKTLLKYNDKDLVKLPDANAGSAAENVASGPTGPAFRHIYNKMGPSFPGEYMPPLPNSQTDQGMYIWSYPGVAFNFPLQHGSWSPDVDFVSILSSSAAASAVSMAIFSGQSWEEARQDLMSRPCPHPRSLALSSRGKEHRPDEIDLIRVYGNGKINLERRASPDFQILLGKTTPQDLVAELGPPDAIHHKYDHRLSIHKNQHRARKAEKSSSRSSPANHDVFADTDESSTHTITDESELEDQADASDNANAAPSAECFYNYFHHGFDLFISYPTDRSPTLPTLGIEEMEPALESNTNKLVATKMLIHGNVPGSYQFNRYRRSRWEILFQHAELEQLDSETPFTTVYDSLSSLWPDNQEGASGGYGGGKDLTMRAMLLNRDWGDSPASSYELLGRWEESRDVQRRDSREPSGTSGSAFSNTKLYGFPGLLFEVLKNDAVSCLTVY